MDGVSAELDPRDDEITGLDRLSDRGLAEYDAGLRTEHQGVRDLFDSGGPLHAFSRTELWQLSPEQWRQVIALVSARLHS